jgi:hypothetical protein
MNYSTYQSGPFIQCTNGLVYAKRRLKIIKKVLPPSAPHLKYLFVKKAFNRVNLLKIP